MGNRRNKMRLKRNNSIIEVDANNSGNKIIGNVNGESIELEILSSDKNSIRYLYNNEISEAVFAEDKDKYYIHIDGKQYVFTKLEDEEDILSEDGSSADIEHIVPPMPGTIIKVNVKVGDKVNEGDAIVVVEAMKMETNLYTRINGTVTKVNVNEGDRVDSNTTLVVIEV
jgi:biotin carboxyl carrier protein